jgi:hypothetical protein
MVLAVVALAVAAAVAAAEVAVAVVAAEPTPPIVLIASLVVILLLRLGTRFKVETERAVPGALGQIISIVTEATEQEVEDRRMLEDWDRTVGVVPALAGGQAAAQEALVADRTTQRAASQQF